MGAPETVREIPAFLERREPLAQYAYWSDGRLQVVKGDETVFLSPDDLAEFWRFFARCEGLKA